MFQWKAASVSETIEGVARLEHNSMDSAITDIEPPIAAPVFAQADTNDVPVGNPQFTAELIAEGKLGLFLPRDRANLPPIHVSINVVNHWSAIRDTLVGAINRLLENKTGFLTHDLADRSRLTAEVLADGCCLMTYMKLRALIFLDFPSRYNSISLRKPGGYQEIPVPAPFAFAIQQLGAVNVADMPKQHRLVPVFPEADHRFGIIATRTWNPNAYAQAVAYARNLGMQFSFVNPEQKSGTSWWLLRPVFAEGRFELQCSVPEVNFTNTMAITYTLYLPSIITAKPPEIFDLSPVGTSIYGSMLRNPHRNINVNTFEAIREKAPEVALV